MSKYLKRLQKKKFEEELQDVSKTNDNNSQELTSNINQFSIQSQINNITQGATFCIHSTIGIFIVSCMYVAH